MYLWNLSWPWLLSLAAALSRNLQTLRLVRLAFVLCCPYRMNFCEDIILQAAQSLTAIYRALQNDADGVEDELMEP